MSKKVSAKKHLGQHFLNDLQIAKDIADALSIDNYKNVLEIGPGMGVLTQFIINKDIDLKVVEIDRESVKYLESNVSIDPENIIGADFLKLELEELFETPFALIGNFPYNISSQILFKALDYKEIIPEIVGMFQKEVAERVVSGPGTKKYGIISVLLQTYYDGEYLFTVNEDVFTPAPKVKSGVIRLKRNKRTKLECDESFYIKVVKGAFGQRRKTLRNALKSITLPLNITEFPFQEKRAEQLSVADFILLTQHFEQ
ncbi:MAG: 16S rRNA (adenine(1518)-N(6)/adenine(1519)-N(6))-dimethyltransferase RsmA [Flavobacteriales bacterium]